MLFIFKVIGLSGNENTYDTKSIASVICFTNFTVVTLQWLNMSANFSFTTNQIKDNELSLTLEDPISQETHGTMFICEIVNQLPFGKNQTSTIEFVIRTSEECKILFDKLK